jgi:hypothetical protein
MGRLDSRNFSVLGLALSMVAWLPFAAHADAFLPAIGGPGGGQFKAQCGAEEQLAGFELRVGHDVDAIRGVCVTAKGPREIGARPLTAGSGLVTTGPQTGLLRGPSELESGWYGGTGGHIERLLCPDETPVVVGIDVAAEGAATVVVNNIHLYCGIAAASQELAAHPANVFDAPGYRPTPGAFGIEALGGRSAKVSAGSQRCPSGQVAVGVHGRSGKWLDAMGLICGAPRVQKAPVALGRVPPSKPSPTPAAQRIDALPDRAGGAGRIHDRSSAETSTPFAQARRAAMPTSVMPAAPGPVQGRHFAPPVFDDGAQLWACTVGEDGEPRSCDGARAATLYCRAKGWSGAVRTREDGATAPKIGTGDPALATRRVDGTHCTEACPVVSELVCTP